MAANTATGESEYDAKYKAWPAAELLPGGVALRDASAEGGYGHVESAQSFLKRASSQPAAAKTAMPLPSRRKFQGSTEYQDQFKYRETSRAAPTDACMGKWNSLDDSNSRQERSRTESRSSYVWPSPYLLHQNDGCHRSSKGASSRDNLVAPSRERVADLPSTVTEDGLCHTANSIETDSVGVSVKADSVEQSQSSHPEGTCSNPIDSTASIISSSQRTSSSSLPSGSKVSSTR